MDLYAVSDQVVALLQQRGRLAYRMLKLQFQLEDEQLEALKEELIEVKELAVDKDGKMLVWKGAEGTPAPPSRAPSASQPPASYTPAHLAEQILAEQAAMEARGASAGERKTITALFADIQDSTALIEDLDPEAARRLLDPALQLMMDAVHRYEGFVVQSTGDGILALFGAPIAHEDHPQRALYAALLMQAESKRYAEQLRREQGLNLQIRGGVNTGEVVLRSIRKDDLHTDYTPVGHSIHLAARMESLASGGAVVVSEGTYKLIAGYFECQALGEAKVKGVTEPIPIYQVLGVGPLRTRLQVAARRGFTRFVGRQSELEQMQKALERATAGHGQIVGVMGERAWASHGSFMNSHALPRAAGWCSKPTPSPTARPRPICRSLNCSRTTFRSDPRTMSARGGRRWAARCSCWTGGWKRRCLISLPCWALTIPRPRFSR
jgi:class 3 adenylate cyclase